MKVYRIVNWDKLYENNRTRELKKIEWVPVPNKHDGDGYTLTATQEDGASLLGAWIVILQTASKCGIRGTLMRDTAAPHNSESIARLTRLPEPIIRRALEWFTSSDVQWMEVIDYESQRTVPQEGAGFPHQGAAVPQDGDYRREGKGIERNGLNTNNGAVVADDPFFDGVVEPKEKQRQMKRPKDCEEIVAYCASIGLDRKDGEHLWNHWESNGWKRGQNKIMDWKAAVRSWKTGGWLPSQNGKIKKAKVAV